MIDWADRPGFKPTNNQPEKLNRCRRCGRASRPFQSTSSPSTRSASGPTPRSRWVELLLFGLGVVWVVGWPVTPPPPNQSPHHQQTPPQKTVHARRARRTTGLEAAAPGRVGRGRDRGGACLRVCGVSGVVSCLFSVFGGIHHQAAPVQPAPSPSNPPQQTPQKQQILIVTPFDVVKIRLQEQHGLDKVGGFGWVWGYGGLCGVAVLVLVCLYIHTRPKQNHQPNHLPPPPPNNQQAKLQYQGPMDAAVKIVKHEGAAALWSGVTPTIARNGIQQVQMCTHASVVVLESWMACMCDCVMGMGCDLTPHRPTPLVHRSDNFTSPPNPQQ